MCIVGLNIGNPNGKICSYKNRKSVVPRSSQKFFELAISQ